MISSAGRGGKGKDWNLSFPKKEKKKNGA